MTAALFYVKISIPSKQQKGHQNGYVLVAFLILTYQHKADIAVTSF